MTHQAVVMGCVLELLDPPGCVELELELLRLELLELDRELELELRGGPELLELGGGSELELELELRLDPVRPVSYFDVGVIAMMLRYVARRG